MESPLLLRMIAYPDWWLQLLGDGFESRDVALDDVKAASNAVMVR